ncbi:MAG: hypothetical protein SFT90_04275 [Rickettsiales bacterium]|nr:hypothetical protein [Rickettsiales bacterium]
MKFFYTLFLAVISLYSSEAFSQFQNDIGENRLTIPDERRETIQQYQARIRSERLAEGYLNRNNNDNNNNQKVNPFQVQPQNIQNKLPSVDVDGATTTIKQSVEDRAKELKSLTDDGINKMKNLLNN